MSRCRVITALIMSWFVAVRLSAQAGGAAVRTEVQQAVRLYVDAWNKADASNLVEMYSREPGVTSVGDGEIIRGWDRIRERYDSVVVGLAGRFNVAIGSIDVVPLGPSYAMALTSYTLTIHTDRRDVQQRGAMTLVFQKMSGEWKVIHDHTSSTHAEGAAAAAAPTAAPVAPAATPVASPPAVPPSITIPITNGQAVEIEPQKLVHYTFQLPAATCVITGRIVGISGGGKDFEALILDDDNFRNWSAGHQARAYWQSGRVVVVNIENAVVTGPGTFHLVLSNVFSGLTSKTVQAQALAQCSR